MDLILENSFICEFLSNFSKSYQIKIAKYLIIIGIDHISKFFSKNSNNFFQQIKQLSSLLILIFLN